MRASGYDRVKDDWYVEPPWIVDALLGAEKFEGECWDPACGEGNIPKCLMNKGLSAFGTDIIDRGYGEISDFMTETRCTNNIITNPPYSLAEEFCLHAIVLASNKVAVLTRLAFLESTKRLAFFRYRLMARVWVSSRRVSMPPGGSGIKAQGGSIAYAWFVWDKSYTGPPIIGWV